MTPEPRTAAGRLRGISAGLLTASLAVAAHGTAHGTADGAAPTGTAFVLLAVLAATVGGLATTIARTADPRALLGLLATSQLTGHVMLSAAGHSHGEPSTPAPAMLVSHALAVVTGAVLIAAANRLCRAVSRVVQVAARAVVPPIPGKPLTVACADQPLRSALLLSTSMSYRGPPVRHAR